MKNIVLIGMPGAGKSTIGSSLGKRIEMQFIDTDLIIEGNEKKTLQDIIDRFGGKKFIQIEESVIRSLILRNYIIATGGSVVYSSDSITHLKKNGIIIYLKLSYEEIKKRLFNIKSRGITMDKDQSLKDLYEERVPLYEKYADIIIDCSLKSVNEIENIIIAAIKDIGEGT